jgi:hypothetical protein
MFVTFMLNAIRQKLEAGTLQEEPFQQVSNYSELANGND